MKLLLFLEVCVELSQTFQGQLVRESDELGLGQVLLLKRLDLNRVGRGEKHNLRLVHQGNDTLNNFLEVIAEELVDFI